MSEKKFKITTLGCRTNQYESEAYRNQLLGLGLREAEAGEKADLCIVNTCTVTESADSSSRHEIRRFLRENEGAEVVVTGCMAQGREGQLLKLGSSRVVPNDKKEQLVEMLFPDMEVPPFVIDHFAGHTRAFVKVQDGCNSFCTYCIIPYVRGRSRSRSIEEVVAEVEGLVAAGYKEVVLTGINIGDFDGSGKRLVDLVRAVDRIEGLVRLRLSSIDPDEVDEALQEALLNGKTTCPSLHLVLQSGSNVVLKRMNRKYTRQIFLETVERLRKAAPDFTFTTDVIVGFPGETEVDFEETLAVVREVGFPKVHMFPYSRRERTRAALYPDQVPAEVISDRKARLLKAAEQSAFQARERYIGRKMTVLVEEGGMGHTENFLPVEITGFPSNTLVEVLLTSNTPRGLVGRP